MSEAPNIIALGVNDKEKAEAWRERLRPLIQALGEVIAEGQRDGFRIAFQINVDNFGRPLPANIEIVKVL